jgi:hypothetical protein
MTASSEAGPGGSAELPPITSQPRLGAHCLSQQQRGLLAVMDRLNDRHSYQMACAATFAGPVDQGRLAAALTCVCRRHTALLTSLRPTPTGVVQHVDPANQPRLEHTALARPASQDAVAAWHRDVAKRRRPWDAAPLSSFHLLHSRESSHLLLATHHLVFDLWSWGVLLRDLAETYQQPEPSPSEAARRVVTYSDYCHWQHTHVSGAYYQQHLDYWRRLAAGYPPTGIPLAAHTGTDPAGSTEAAAQSRSFTIPSNLVAALRDLAEANSTRLFRVLLALFHVAIARLTGLDDELVGSATGNRTQPGTAETVGFFANGRYTRTHLDATATLADLIQQTSRQWSRSDQHRELHLEQLVEDLGKPGLVNVKFSLQDALARTQPATLGAATVTATHLPTTATSRRDLSVTLSPQGPNLDGRITYRTAALSLHAAQALLTDYQRVLAIAVERPDTPVWQPTHHTTSEAPA